MWKLLKGQKLELKDLYRLDNALENKFEFIRTAENDELDVLELDGSINSFTGEKIQLISGNITKENRKKYLYLAKEYKQNEFNEIIELIRFGISKVKSNATKKRPPIKRFLRSFHCRCYHYSRRKFLVN